jgi:hypothetical protein
MVSRSAPGSKRTTVINQLIAALVALLKRGWLEHPDQRREFFQVCQRMQLVLLRSINKQVQLSARTHTARHIRHYAKLLSP